MDGSIETVVLLGALSFAAFTVQTIAGFGASLVIVGVGSLFLPVSHLVVVAVALSPIPTGYVLARHHQHIDKRLLLHEILPMAGIGVVVSLLFLAPWVSSPWVKPALGLWIMAGAGYDLLRLVRPDMLVNARPPSHYARRAWMFAAGLVHGMFATGGPALVYALSKTDIPKSALRSTLMTVWLTLNVGLVVTFLLNGRLDIAGLQHIALVLPAVALAIGVGEWAHHRIPSRPFKLLVSFLLVGTGAVLMASS